jgi:hypothetical protein
MPATAKDEPKPDPTPTPKTTPETTAPDKLAANDVPPGRQPEGAYEFTGPIPTQYLEVPLTARPADADNPATVFDWPFSAPDDGRWQPTKKKPNQLPDNAPANPEE